jgi:hypothetical protein
MDGARVEGAMKEKREGKEDACLRIHPLVKVFPAGEEVSDSVRVSRDMFEGKVEILEEFHPSSLIAGNLLQLVEVL